MQEKSIYKKLILGLIRFIESEDQDANIPAHFFQDVNDDFVYGILEDEQTGEELLGFQIVKLDERSHLRLVK